MSKLLLGSASMLQRTIECPASHHLPIVRKPHKNAMEAAARGTRLHSWLENAVPDEQGETKPYDISKHQRKVSKYSLEDFAGWGSRRKLRELSFVWSPEATRVVGRNRNYGQVSEHDVPGTADVIHTGYLTFEVYDYKTGRWFAPDPEKNHQLLHLATCVWRALTPKAQFAVIGLQYLRGHGKVITRKAIITPMEMEAHEDRLKKAQDKARTALRVIGEGGTPEVKHGEHCRWCPASPGCPYWKDNQGEWNEMFGSYRSGND